MWLQAAVLLVVGVWVGARPSPTLAVPAFVQNLGTASGGPASSIAITTSGAVAAGTSIIVAIGTGTFSPVSLTCSDPVNGAYTTDVIGGVTGASRAAICSKHDVQALPAGSSITIQSSRNDHILVASASEFSGLAPSGAFDRGNAAIGSSTAPSVTLAQSTSQADELLVTAVHWSGASTFSPGSNGTANVCSNTGASTYGALPVGALGITKIAPQFCIVSSAAQYQGNGTFNGGEVWTALIATYRMAPPPPTATPTSTPTRTPTSAPTNIPTSTPSPAPTSTPTTVETVTPTSTPTPTVRPAPSNTPSAAPQIDSERDRPERRLTAEQGRQKQLTNQSNRDDEFTEGNVLEVGQDEQGRFIVIGNRDGSVVVRLRCGDQCPTIKVGDYVEVDGVKENEQLFYADQIGIANR
jgi:hypothetical protein